MPRAIPPLVTATLCLAALCLAAVGCQSPEEAGCQLVPKSGILLYDKLELQGVWEHTATVVDVMGDADVAPGTESPSREVTWVVGEERLVARDAEGPKLGFLIDSHWTAGFLTDGRQCLVDDPRPWHERRYVRVDWSVDAVADPSVLPFDATGWTVEAVHWFPDVAPDEPPFRFERDELGRLDEVVLALPYLLWTDCADCEPTEVLVEHRFLRTVPE